MKLAAFIISFADDAAAAVSISHAATDYACFRQMLFSQAELISAFAADAAIDAAADDY